MRWRKMSTNAKNAERTIGDNILSGNVSCENELFCVMTFIPSLI